MQKRNPKQAPVSQKPVEIPSKEIKKSWLYIFVAAIAFLLYINTIGHDYTVDDGTVIKNNKQTVQGISALGKIFTSPYRAGFWDRKEGLYRPLSVAMFAIEWQLAPEKPWLGHLVNILLYTLTSIALFATMRKILQKHHPLIPLVATLLFIVHPLHTEVVANIKSRDEILAFLFGISSLYFLLRYSSENKMQWMITACITYFLCLLSKESSITWMGVFPIALYCIAKCDLKKTILYSLPLLGMALIFLFIRSKVLGPQGGNYEVLLINNSLIGITNMSDRFATAIAILGKYFWLLFFPVTLVFDYSYSTIPAVSPGNIQALVPMLIYATLLVYAVFKLKERSLYSFAILFFLGTIVLLSNIFFLIEATMAERFLYTPSLGFCIAIALLSEKFLRKVKNKEISKLTVSDLRSNNILILSASVVILLFGGRTLARSADWKNNITLLAKDVQSAPQSARIRYAYGSALLIEKALVEKDPVIKNNYLDMSIEQLKTGVSIIPNYNDAWYNLGLAYKEKGDAKNAIAAFEQSNSYRKFTDPSKLASAGIAYGMAGQYDKAIENLQQSLNLDSTSADTWNNFGLYLSEAGKHEEALKAFDKALQFRKDFDKVYYNRGNAWAKIGQFQIAIEQYKKSLDITPGYSEAYNNIGNCYAAMNQPAEAKPWFLKAVESDPNNVKALANLSITFRIMGDTASAKLYEEKAHAMGIAN